MRDKISTFTWSDGIVLTRKMAQLQEALMEYQMYASPPDFGKGCLGGDTDVQIAVIELQNCLTKLREKSIAAGN